MRAVFVVVLFGFVLFSFGQKDPLVLSKEQRTQLSSQDVILIDSIAHYLTQVSDDSTIYSNYNNLFLNLDSRSFKEQLALWYSTDLENKLAAQNSAEGKEFYWDFKAALLNIQGIDLVETGDLEGGLKKMHASLDIRIAMSDSIEIADAYANMGLLYFNNAFFDLASEYWTKAIRIQENLEQWNLAARTLTYVAALEIRRKDFDKAREYLNKSIDYANLINDVFTQAMVYERMASLDRNTKNYDSAIISYKKALVIYSEANNKKRVASIYNSIAAVYRYLKNYPLSLKNAKKALAIAEETNYLRAKTNATHLLYLSYQDQNKYKEALDYFNQYRNLKDSVYNNQNTKVILQKEADFKLRQQYVTDSIKRAETLKTHEANLALERQKTESRSKLLWVSLMGLFLLTIAVIIIVKRFAVAKKLNQVIANEKVKLDQVNNELTELHQSRTHFFGNISHEFRTPLTVIQGMSSQIIEDPEKYGLRGGQMIKRNSETLLQLVNQILSLRKIETGNLKANTTNADVVSFVRYLFESFQSYAEHKTIKMSITVFAEEFKMDFDPDKLQSIISNLLSNAIKFNRPKGQVDLALAKENDHLIIEVKDSGIGISPKKAERIFDRFYQVDDSATREGEGTGIGLNLTKELVELLNGKIKVDSSLNEGSAFIVSLPITQVASTKKEVLVETNFTRGLEIEMQTTPINNALQNLLIIEDNIDVQQYLQSLLGKTHNISFAENGEIGIEKAITEIPDIIITDVMMPVKDGFEVVEHLKNNEYTSHIPIIMLTARAEQEDRIKGLTRGADAYLHKPFNKEELQLILRNFNTLREKLRARYAQTEILDTPETDLVIEDAFMLKLNSILEEELDNAEFSIPDLCDRIGASRTQLHRKLKTLTGFSASIYVRNYRLIKARKMLRSQENKRISEVAYSTGFTSAPYFSNQYKKYFGITPKEDSK